MNSIDNGKPAFPQPAAEHKSRRVFNIAAILLILSLLLFLSQLVNFQTFKASANALDSLPVSIRAASQANYSRDMQDLSIPPIRGDILAQIIADNPGSGSDQFRMAALQLQLSMPVSPVTSDPTNAAPSIIITPVVTQASTPVPPPDVTSVPPDGSQPTVQPSVSPSANPPKPGKPPKAEKPPKPDKPPKPEKPPKPPKP